VLDGVMEAAAIPQDKRVTVLRAIDKLDRLGTAGVRSLLGPGRLDESGDFTKGAALEKHQIDTLLGFAAAATTELMLDAMEEHIASEKIVSVDMEPWDEGTPIADDQTSPIIFLDP